MIKILVSIFDTVRSLVLFIIHLGSSLIALFMNIPKYLTYLTNIVLNVPAVYIPFLTATLGIYAMFLILNRSENG